MTRAEHKELAAFDRKYPQQWCIPREHQPRYYELFAKDEEDYAAEVARLWRWERRRPALQTIADVAFWFCAVPFWVIYAIDGAVGAGTLTIALLWLGLRCEWSFLPWKDTKRGAAKMNGR